ncbi:MAG: ribonuclease Z [Nanoarchaeota archaeon]|nr:ribonuclease Z [Nanoarchaeota archaeon]MBU1135286.1 ribonuclease Z [Nanoarchaeota archaeon]MBU2520337.1 ribonuclease Z [Nanoarchaeota archaeon]
MIEIVFLGTGSAVPSKKRNASAIWLHYDTDFLLWDCGEGTQKQMMTARVSFMKIKRIFITHWHADHWAGLIGLTQTMSLEGRKKPLYIYGPDAERFVNNIKDLDYRGQRFQIIPKNVPYEGNEITKIVEEDKYDILSAPMNHTVPSVAYCFKEHDAWNVDLKKCEKYGLKQSPLVGKLKKEGKVEIGKKTIMLEDVSNLKKGLKIVYTGDTKPCKNLDEIVKDADLLIHDSTFLDEKHNRMHSGAKGAGLLAKKSGVKKLILTHFSRRYVDVKPLIEEAKKNFKNTIAAEDFMRVKLKR